MRLSNWRKWAIAVALASATLWIIVVALRIGIADFVSLEARFLVDKSLRDHRRLPIQLWLRAENQLLESRSWDGNNPVFDEYLANLYFSRAEGYPPSSQEQKTFYEVALDHYLRAAYLRPTSGYTHASIATVKFRLGKFDKDFFLALSRAAEYGPWERPVQVQVIETGLSTWGALDDPARVAVRGSLKRLLQTDPKAAKALLDEYRSVLPPCPEIGVPGICQQDKGGNGAGLPALRH